MGVRLMRLQLKPEMKKTKLSVNVNKIASLRNARGKNIPDLTHITKLILQTPVHGITVHPRPDERHIRYTDVFDLKKLLEKHPDKEYNMEGYPSSQFLSLIEKTKPHQCTLVPDPPEVLTSNAGWDFFKNKTLLKKTVQDLKAYPIRSSLFLDPLSMNKRQWQALSEIRPDRIELYTESYADSWGTEEQEDILSLYQKTAFQAKHLNIQINAGHDLNQKNLFDLLKALPEIEEVSIGQALISEALEEGLKSVITKYLNIMDRAFDRD